jgi:endonuclease G
MPRKKSMYRASIKEEILLEAAERYNQSVESGFKSVESIDRSLKNDRQRNYTIRETAKSRIGLTESAEALFRIEEAQIDTWDVEKRPPHQIAEECGKPVARIIDNTEDQRRGFGSGFLISDKLFMTNYHVFPDVDYAMDCEANFGHEYDKSNNLLKGVSFSLDPRSFFINDRKLDFAIVGISGRSTDNRQSITDQGLIKLIETPGKIIQGSDINIIQYPRGNHKQYACKQNQVLKIFEKEGLIQYKTDTAKASSGSPCFNKSWELAALHHCAIPLVINKQVIDVRGNPWDHRNEDDVRWISNEGISISSIISFLKANLNNFTTAHIEYLIHLLGQAGDPVLVPRNLENGNGTATVVTGTTPLDAIKQQSHNNDTMATNVFNFYGSTVIYVGIPPATTDTTDQKKTATEVTNGQFKMVEQSAIEFDEDYESRDDLGYNPDFLEGYTLSIPKIEDSRITEMVREDGKVVEFKYYNYSLAMNKKRRMCIWTAVNVDYGKKPNKKREDFGRDTWRPDPRLEDMFQILKKELYDPAKNIDLGHVVRRDDACWGDNDQYIEYANSDTFHLTNCTPQHEAFNQANPKGEEYEGIHGVWGALEEHIKKELKNADNKAIIFAGPSLAKNDPVEDFGHGPIKYPLRFWKVVCALDENGKLFSYGFWLDQSDVVKDFGLGLERLDFDKFKKQQMPIREISDRTKVVFDEDVYKTDVLKNNPFTESSDRGIDYKSVEEIQIRPK